MARKRTVNAQRGRARRHFIREWRKARGLSQERLAARVGVSTASISQLETGKQAYTQPMLEAIADALAVDPGSLLMRNPEDPDGIWSVWDALPAPERPRAIRVLKALRDEADGAAEQAEAAPRRAANR